jgi:polyketide synthase PksN
MDHRILQERAEAYLKSLISDAAAAATLGHEFDSSASFGELGIDSFRVLKIIKRLEVDFGTLPKTLLFENFNINDLAQYFVGKHEVVLRDLLGGADSNAFPAGEGNSARTDDRSSAAQDSRPTEMAVSPILAREDEALAHSEIGPLVRQLFEDFKNESSVSRGTRLIAPNLFIGSARRGYFNYSRSNRTILGYGYTGPEDYFSTLAEEFHRHCVGIGCELNLFFHRPLGSIGQTAFSATPFGVMQRVRNLQDFSLQGGEMRRLRYQVSKFSKAGGCEVREYRCGTDLAVARDIAAIIDQWCSLKTMVNPLIHIVRDEILAGTLDPAHRIFLTYLEGRLQNAILISPLAAQQSGYLMDLEFYSAEMPLGGLEYAIVRIVEILVEEGCDLLSLGGTYGCKLETSDNADLEVEKVLDDLRGQGIFNDEGNLQFKNKFRPHNETIYLCRPKQGSDPGNVLDIIMLVADPIRTQTPDEEHHCLPQLASNPAVGNAPRVSGKDAARALPRSPTRETRLPEADGNRAALLAECDYNPLGIAADKVEFDLKTDSWAQLKLPAIDRRIRSLNADFQQSADWQDSVRQMFPFAHFILTGSGRDAESAFCQAWQKKGTVPQNLLFPTTIFHQIDNGFTPLELPDPAIFRLDSKEVCRGNLDLKALKELLQQDSSSIAYVCMEVDDNAAGGYPVSLANLKALKAILDSHGISLVVDATRIVENAVYLSHHEPDCASKSVWEVVRELSACADALVASLTKDFCVRRGGLIATNDADLARRIRQIVSDEGLGLDAIDRKRIALALQDREHIESQVLRRMQVVERLWQKLHEAAIPVVQPAGLHCILIDVKRIDEFRNLDQPVASFLAWTFLGAGIRAGEHSVGMQQDTPLNGLVRLAIPIGLDPSRCDEIAERLIRLFRHKHDLPDLVAEEWKAEAAAGAGPRFRVKGYLSPAAMPVSDGRRIEAGTEASPAQVACASSGSSEPSPVAIVGMAGRYPRAANMSELWTNLVQGVDCVGSVPEGRFLRRRQSASSPSYRGGFVSDIDRFDSLFFNISPREAETLDPQERLFLEVAWETLEDAGYYPEVLVEEGQPRHVGVFVGAVWAMYQTLGSEERLLGNPVIASSFLWSIANRVSYFMNLTGPSMAVDTACSASLTAVYLACEALQKGECSAALVGGVNLDVHQCKQDITMAGGLLSEDGYCRAFGRGANGYVPGEGVGAILLKPLDKAQSDGDNIYGVIRGVAINHGGKTSGYSVPNPKAQAELIASALRKARIDPRSVGYIEAHGTGTELGDPIEISGLSSAFSDAGVPVQSCAIGSIKTNIGHLEAAAGIAGICKVLLQMRHRTLVPSLHSAELNEFIDFTSSPFQVQQVAAEWQAKEVDGVRCPLRAGISSFGAGGSNAHVIIDSVESSENEAVPSESRVFPLSAHTESQLRDAAQRLRGFVRSELDRRSNQTIPNGLLRNIAFTLQVGRKSFDHRLAIVAETGAELNEKLALFLDGRKDQQIFAGSAKSSQGISRLLNHREKAEFINLLTRERDLARLAQLWVDGLLGDWQGMRDSQLSGGKARRVSLPGYPFADKRHWISASAKGEDPRPLALTQGSGSALHPLLDRNESTFERQLFSKVFTDQDFVIHDHLVSEIPTLPGVAYLDLVRQAGEISVGRRVSAIRNILWVSPLTVKDSAPTLARVELKPSGNHVQFEVFSEGENGHKQLYAQGKLVFDDAPGVDREPEYVDIDEIRSRCKKVIDGRDAYPLFKSMGLDLGPSFQVLHEVFANEQEVLGSLRISEERAAGFQEFVLHPSLVDGSFQALMGAKLGSESGGGMIVPYSLGEVEILNPLTPRCYSYVTDASDGKKSGSGLSKKHVLILDEHGKVLVRVRDSVGVPLTDVHEKPTKKSNPDASSGDDDEFVTLYYSTQWRPSPLPDPSPSGKGDRTFLLFHDDEKLRQICLQRLGQEQSRKRVILVRPGNEFRELDEATYEIDPTRPEDFTRLFDGLKEKGGQPEEIFFAWTSALGPDSQESYCPSGTEAILRRGVHSFLYLSQTIIHRKLDRDVGLTFLFESRPGRPDPLNEAMNGFMQILRAESPSLRCKVLEFQQSEPASGPDIVDCLLAESGAGSKAMAVRYSDGTRLVRQIGQIDAGELTLPEAGLRDKGVYLITGGAGGLGLIFAEFMARQVQARLVLTGRSELSAEQKSRLDQIESLGAEVLYVRADVAQMKDVQALVDEARSRFGRIDGVIHSAGILRDSFVRNKTSQEMEAVFAPKVHGTLCLDEATCADSLDFFVLFSSLAAIAGNAGQSDYSYANHFMDSFARQRELRVGQGQRSGRTVSLNWSLWADGGMQLDEQTLQFFKKNLGIRPLSIQTGVDSLVRALAANLPNFAVIEGDQKLIEKAWGIGAEQVAEKAAPVAQPAVDTSVPAEAGTGELFLMVQDRLSRIVMDFLKLDESDVDLDSILLDLGFDSIGLTTFSNSVNEVYGLDVTPVLFFEYTNIREIARYIATEHESEASAVHHVGLGSSATAQEMAPLVSVHPASVGFGSGKKLQLAPSPATSPSSGGGFSPARRFVEQPIAVVGMSGVMPQSDNLKEYWEKLKDSENNMVTLVPPDRWSWQEYYGDPLEEENKTLCKWGGFMREVDKFDPLFWGISPREAEMMDPQQRIFLESVWSAIEDAGHRVSDLAGTRTGLFVGASTRDYIDLMAAQQAELDGYSASGTSHAVLANRVSFLLDLKGPSAPLDTACSSSLVALHRAIESIHTGSSDMAIVGGVQVMLTPAGHISFGAAGMLASDGRCKTFDARADGYVRGEGSGAILIKPLSRAEADNDHIYAVIKSTAENHGGRATMLTAPNPNAQADLLVEAYEKAEIDPSSVGMIECHGTGTPLGDPIEIQALKKAFSELYKKLGKAPPSKPHIGLTSAKSNIGHLETAAGIAGILKVLLAIKHRQIPALLHFEAQNPYINISNTPFYMVDKTQPWESLIDPHGNPIPRRAGINSFGFGGANVHAVFEEYVPVPAPRDETADGPQIVVLSAKNADRLNVYVERLLRHIESDPVVLRDCAYTLQVGRDPMSERIGLVVRSIDELKQKLAAVVNGETGVKGVFRGKVSRAGDDLSITNLDADVRETIIDRWISAGSLDKLVEAWVKGLEFNWEKLHQGARPRRLSLPTYPFARERYWFRPADPSCATRARTDGQWLHPLVHENTSTLRQQSFSSVFSGREFFLADVFPDTGSGMKILPMMACVEMARAALEIATQDERPALPLALTDLEWKPAHVPASGGQFVVSLFAGHSLVAGAERIDLQIVSLVEAADDAMEENLHFQCRLAGTPADDTGAIDLAELTADMLPVDIGSTESTKHLGRMGIGGGLPDDFSVNVLPKGAGWLCRLQVQQGHASSSDALVLQPELLGQMLQAAVVLGLEAEALSANQATVLQASSIEIFAPSGLELLAWIRHSAQPGRALACVDVDLVDAQGNPCVRIRGLKVIRTRREPPRGHGVFVGLPVWMPLGSEVPKETGQATRRHLVLCDVRTSQSSLEQFLPGVNGSTLECGGSKVSVSERYSSAATQCFERIRQILEAEMKTASFVQVVIDESLGNYAASGLSALLKSAALEHPTLQGQVVVADTSNAEHLAEMLKLAWRHPNEPIIRFRDKAPEVHRWQEVVDSGAPVKVALKDHGAYVITGGAGELGLIFAREILSKASKARVILTGRSPVNDDKIKRIEALDAPERVSYCQLDITDLSEVERFFAATVECHGAVTGIIHSAGMIADGPLMKKDVAVFQQVLAPKVTGAVNLDLASRKLDLDFLVLFSSVSSINGNPAQSDYAAANGFLDRFAAFRNALVADGKRHGRTLAINWPLWKNGGMTVPDALADLIEQATGMCPMHADQGLAAFHRALSLDVGQLLVMEGKLETIRSSIGRYLIDSPIVESRPGPTTCARRSASGELSGRAVSAANPVVEQDPLTKLLRELVASDLEITELDLALEQGT